MRKRPSRTHRFPEALSFGVVPFPLGTLYLVFSDDIICGVSFSVPPLRRRPCPRGVARQFNAYFAGALRTFELRIGFLAGTDFQRRVWEGLLEIPYGENRSYGWLAQRVGAPRGQRAVGQALGANPLPVVLPCHRVVRADGLLGGFSGGSAVKAFLIGLEQCHMRRSLPEGEPV
ncbi:MAG: methylated-DNA--[protein]-cysteine S-methyltransferase [Thermodesulfovibrionales bacterium]